MNSTIKNYKKFINNLINYYKKMLDINLTLLIITIYGIICWNIQLLKNISNIFQIHLNYLSVDINVRYIKIL